MRARLLVQPRGAPGCCVLLPAKAAYSLGDGDSSVLFQLDHDQWHLASHLGWGGKCACCHDEPEPDSKGRTAWEWLCEHDGETFDDPGYLE